MHLSVYMLSQGFNKNKITSACMFYAQMLFSLAFLTVDQPAGRHPSICSAPARREQAESMQTADQDLHALIYSDGCGPHASAFADIPPSLYQPTNICLGINHLQHTCYLPTVMPVNAWPDAAVLLLAALSVV